jgi:hypothetical protein
MAGAFNVHLRRTGIQSYSEACTCVCQEMQHDFDNRVNHIEGTRGMNNPIDKCYQLPSSL